MKKLELSFISSAILSFGRIQPILDNAEKIGKKEQYKLLILKVLDKLNNISDVCTHGVMWNALTEKKDKSILKGISNEMERSVMVQADSGGLQILTLGLKDDDTIKEEVYRNQANNCDYAMSFDKMPIKLRENSSGLIKMNHGAKIFVAELAFSSGRESGKNICKQIDTFRELKSFTKVLVILQGWSIDEYNEYARGVFSVFNEMDEDLRNDYFSYIGGISLGTTAVISYFHMLDMFCRAPIDLNNVPEQFRSLIHILALGGITKSGVLFSLKDNFFNKKVHYTFDSTAFVSSPTFGKYTDITETNEIKNLTFNTCSLGYEDSPLVDNFIQEIKDTFGEIITSTIGFEGETLAEFKHQFSPWRNDKTRTHTEIKAKYKEILTENEIIEIYLNSTLVNHFLHFALEFIKTTKIVKSISEGNYNVVGDKTIKNVLRKLHTLENYDDYMKNREWFINELKYKKESKMTYCKTLEDFNKISEEGIDEDEW